MDEDEIKDWEKDLRQDYKIMQEDIAYERETLTEEVKYELMKFYYTFFNVPEKLTVVYNGEIIK